MTRQEELQVLIMHERMKLEFIFSDLIGDKRTGAPNLTGFERSMDLVREYMPSFKEKLKSFESLIEEYHAIGLQ